MLWLDDLEAYVGGDGLTSPTLDRLLAGADRHVVVLATLREGPDFERYLGGGFEDRTVAELAKEWRDLLDRAVQIRMTRAWTSAEREEASRFADDVRIAEALQHADDFGPAEYLAAGPKLLALWRAGWDVGNHPRGAALVAAAADARRAGCHWGLPLDLLQELHGHYLRQRHRRHLVPEPWDDAVAWATALRHGTSGLLMRDDDDRYVVFDYLPAEMDADPDAPPVLDPVWPILIKNIDPAQMNVIGCMAEWRGHREHALAALRGAVEGGYRPAAVNLAYCLGETFGDGRAAVEVLRTAMADAQDLVDSGELTLSQLDMLRSALAWWTGLAGDPREARLLASQRLADNTHRLGLEHRQTLTSRLSVIRWTGESGDTTQALRLAREAVADSTRLLGADDPLTTSARFEVALWTGYDGDAAEAIRLWQELDDYLTLQDPADWIEIVHVRRNLAFWMFLNGDVDNGRTFLKKVVADHARILGDKNLFALSARVALAHAVGQAGDPAAAAELAKTVLADCAESIDHHHPVTLNCRFEVALWTGSCPAI